MAEVLVSYGDGTGVTGTSLNFTVGLTFFGVDVEQGFYKDGISLPITVPAAATGAQLNAAVRAVVVAKAATIPNVNAGTGVTIPANAIIVPQFTRI